MLVLYNKHVKHYASVSPFQIFSSARMGVDVSESTVGRNWNCFAQYVALNESYCNCTCNMFNKSIL